MDEFTPYHSQYLAHRVTLEGYGDDAFAKSLSTARVDMNPHQVDAALFALQSPLSRGVILADEVGLGKTIEASLVIAQKWAERKRRILLVVPASLRKQWQQELRDKFSLPSQILDAKTYRELQKAGEPRPFRLENMLIIASYEFAARKADELVAVAWDLVIYDEAHRLRNVYKKNGSKRAKELKQALAQPHKLLLTATPLQNSLMELYGLVSMIDDHHFGDEKSFRSLYVRAGASPAALAMLRRRLEPVCKRTLRRQVQEAGHFNFTRRIPRTFDFEPANQEVTLYEKVSAYLQRTDTIAFGDKPNQLITLTARKILGSSTLAIVQFLDRVIDRLERKKAADFGTVEDVDIADELAEEMEEFDGDDEGEAPVDPKLLAAEIAELKEYRALAASIGANAKGEKLVAKLPEVLDEIVGKNGKRKAVIFTESVRTQRYLKDLLSNNGYEGQIVLLNGSNSDPESKQLYAQWLERHKGTDAVSGSKTADMKAAVVEAFRSDDKTILLATESGAEGINLQFCSLLVNFDLPWNPQRVEQRIGRCHRYGQLIDVIVVNMLNRRNRAEARVYELLEQKFKLFEGVFGTSDEVLGTIERGIDFERKVLEIVQQSRSDEEIQLQFDFLQKELQEQIDADMLAARDKLFETLDQDVVTRLRTRQDELRGTLNDFTRRLITIARAELPEAHFHGDDSPRFDYEGRTWSTEWPVADEMGWQFFRLADGNLAETLVNRARERPLETAALRFDLAAYPFRLADVGELVGRSGWLKVSKIRVRAQATLREHLVLACVSDTGEPVDCDTADRMFLVPARCIGMPVDPVPEEALASAEDAQVNAVLRETEQQNAAWLETESDKLDAYAEDLEQAAEAEIKDLETEIKTARKNLRASASLGMTEKLAEKRRIQRLEAERDQRRLETFERRKTIRQEVDAMLDDIAASLETRPEIEPLFTIRWEVTNGT